MTENDLQRAADRLVQNEVCYCVSGLIYALREVYERLDDSDEYVELTSGRSDYEEAVRAFVMDDADLYQLEEIAENFGYWSDVLHTVGAPEGLENVSAWLESRADSDTPHNQIRRLVFDFIDDYPAVCNDYGLEPEYLDIYEHWLVTGWLADKLQARGEVVEEYLGLTIWGRATTGQAISMDYVIQDIAKELHDYHPD